MTLFWQVTHSITIESTYTILARYALTLERMLLKVKIKNENGRVSKTSWINENVIFKWVTSKKTATLCHCLKLPIRRGGGGISYIPEPPISLPVSLWSPPPPYSFAFNKQSILSIPALCSIGDNWSPTLPPQIPCNPQKETSTPPPK